MSMSRIGRPINPKVFFKIAMKDSSSVFKTFAFAPSEEQLKVSHFHVHIEEKERS